MSYSLNLLMVLPELVLTLGAIALMLVAAWGGTNATRGISIAAVFVLAGAMVRAGRSGDHGRARLWRSVPRRRLCRFRQGPDLSGDRGGDHHGAALLRPLAG